MADSLVFNPYAIIQLLVAVFMLLQGLVVLIQNPSSKLNISYFIWELAVFVWLTGMGLAFLFNDAQIARNLCLLGFLGVLYIPITTYAFSVFFNDDKKQYYILILGLAATLILSLFLKTDLIDNGLYRYSWGYYTKLGSFGYPAAALFFIFVPLFCRNYYLKSKAAPPDQRPWYRLTIISGALAFLAGVDFLPGFGVALPFPPPGYIFVGIFATLMGFFILRHQLVNIKFIIGRTVGYSVMTLILLLIYGGIYYLISRKNFSGPGLATQFITFIILLYGLGLLKNWTQKIVDELFFKEKLQLEKMIREFIVKIRDLRDTKSLTLFLFSFIIERLRFQSCAVYIYENNNQRYLVARSQTGNSRGKIYENSLYLKAASFPGIDKQKIILKYDEISRKNPFYDVVREGQRLMEIENGRLALPLSHRDSLFGFIVLGPKQSEEEYNYNEVELISELMVPLSITWQNSIQFEELKNINEFNYNFITILSHQLRTPMTRIKWAVQSIGGASLRTKASLEELKKEIMVSADQAVKIIGSLLASAESPQARLMDSTIAPRRFLEIVNELIFVRMAALEAKKIILNNNLNKNMPSLRCRDDVLKVIVEVLLDNAIKYSRPGGQVDIKGDRGDNTFVLSIKDEGIGIPENESGQIFNKFFRSSNAKSFEPNGNGLGLFYSKLLLERNGGSLWFRSKENKGSTFYCAFLAKINKDYPKMLKSR